MRVLFEESDVLEEGTLLSYDAGTGRGCAGRIDSVGDTGKIARTSLIRGAITGSILTGEGMDENANDSRERYVHRGQDAA